MFLFSCIKHLYFLIFLIFAHLAEGLYASVDLFEAGNIYAPLAVAIMCAVTCAQLYLALKYRKEVFKLIN